MGTELPLKCTKHGAVTMVKTATDFDQMAANGGCNQPCGDILTCGHQCKMICHLNIDHSTYRCTEQCNKYVAYRLQDDYILNVVSIFFRSVCSRANHKCPKLCYQSCGVCTQPLQEKLACGHRVRCFMEEQRDYRCLESVYVEFSCGHRLKMLCNETDSDFDEDVNCSLCDSSANKDKKNTSASFSDSVLNDVDILGGCVGQIKLEDSDSESDVEMPEKPEDLGIFVEKAPPQTAQIRPVLRFR